MQLPVRVVVGALSGTKKISSSYPFLDYAPPFITSVLNSSLLDALSVPTVGDVTLTVTGGNFGRSSAMVLADGVPYSGGMTQHDSSTPHSVLYFNVSAGKGSNRVVHVLAGSQVTTVFGTFAYTPCNRGTYQDSNSTSLYTILPTLFVYVFFVRS